MSVDVDRFARILADRLAAVVPAGFHVEAGDGMLWYSGAGQSGTHVRDNFSVYGETDEDKVTGAAVQALDELQDYVSEATGDPWPGTTRQPRPYAQVRGSLLQLWYGDDDGVALACDPIELAEIVR